MPYMRVVTAPPSRVLVRTTTRTQPGTPSDLQITVTDRFGNHAEDFRGTFCLSENESNLAARNEFSLEPKDIGSKRWQNCIVFHEEGIHRINVESVGLTGTRRLAALALRWSAIRERTIISFFGRHSRSLLLY